MTDFEFSKNVIRQKSNKVLEYHIDQINDSILVLGIELRGMPFELQLRRAVVPAEVPVTVQDSTGLR
jgi:hypothetical protein